MCGRFTLLHDKEDIMRRFQIQTEMNHYFSSYNIAPGQKILAVLHDGRRRRAGYIQWGLVPSWAKDPKIGSKMINARSETVHEKPSFKQLLDRKRCIVIADSFYEWKQEVGGKIAQRILVKDQPLFSFAALWDKWQDGDHILFTCTLLTKEANESIRPIHHRMPIVLSPSEETRWLEDHFRSPLEAKLFLDGVEDVTFQPYAVSNYVNSVKNNDKACIEPIQ